LTERDRGKPTCRNAHHREVGIGIGAHDLAVERASIVQCHPDLGDALDDVVVREDVALAAHDHPGAQRELGLGRNLEALPEEALESGVLEQGLRRRTCRVAEMLTTDGIAFFAPSLKESARGIEHRGRGRQRRRAFANLDHVRPPGKPVRLDRLTTKRAASVKVTAWAKRSQSLRIEETAK
jgi:hypothetical protein